MSFSLYNNGYIPHCLCDNCEWRRKFTIETVPTGETGSIEQYKLIQNDNLSTYYGSLGEICPIKSKNILNCNVLTFVKNDLYNLDKDISTIAHDSNFNSDELYTMKKIFENKRLFYIRKFLKIEN